MTRAGSGNEGCGASRISRFQAETLADILAELGIDVTGTVSPAEATRLLTLIGTYHRESDGYSAATAILRRIQGNVRNL